MATVTQGRHAIGYTLGGLALASAIASTTLNAIFAASITNISGIVLLGFVSVGVNILCVSSLAFFVFCYIPKINSKPIRWTTGFSWRVLSVGITVACIALIAAAATLIWTTIQVKSIPSTIVGQPKRLMLFTWWALWGVSAIAQISCFILLCWWTSHRLHANSIDQSSLDFGIPQAEPMEERPKTQDTIRSFRSQDPTIAATPPRTPPARGNRNSLKSPYSSKMRSSGSRTKLIRNNSFPRDSAKSSFDFTNTERSSVDDGFDGWDTSSVGREMRRTLQASPSVAGPVLETIPGSRPESPAKTLDGPFLPQSPHAATADTADRRESYQFPSSPYSTAVGTFPSPPSSPPNFSRPTSRNYSQTYQPTSALTEDFIHPLFRTSSPHPPPSITPGTTVHAAAMAGQTISPLTLHRMRSGSLPRQSSPLLEEDGTPSVGGKAVHRMRSGSLPVLGSPLTETAEIEDDEDQGEGSPGPSIADETELPPILPGFVLSAGSRSSLVWYGKRKTDKSRDNSSDQSREASL